MDHIDDLTNEHLKEFFLKDLNCLNQLIHFQYPNNLFDEYSIIDEHIIRCQEILRSYIISELSDSSVEDNEIHKIAKEKVHDILTLCEKEITDLIDKANIKTIVLRNEE